MNFTSATAKQRQCAKLKRELSFLAQHNSGGTVVLCPLILPRGLAVNADGDVLVCDGGSHRVRVVDANDELLWSFGESTPGFPGLAVVSPATTSTFAINLTVCMSSSFELLSCFEKTTKLVRYFCISSVKNDLDKCSNFNRIVIILSFEPSAVVSCRGKKS